MRSWWIASVAAHAGLFVALRALVPAPRHDAAPDPRGIVVAFVAVEMAAPVAAPAPAIAPAPAVAPAPVVAPEPAPARESPTGVNLSASRGAHLASVPRASLPLPARLEPMPAPLALPVAVAPPVAPAPRIDTADLFRAAPGDLAHLGTFALAPAAAAPPAAAVDPLTAERARLHVVTQGYLEQVVADAQ